VAAVVKIHIQKECVITC